jgi:hypothetical protein
MQHRRAIRNKLTDRTRALMLFFALLLHLTEYRNARLAAVCADTKPTPVVERINKAAAGWELHI